MAGSVNKVILIGRLGKDPELKYTPSGAPVVNFSLATDESFKDRSGEQQNRTEWHRIVAWGKLAEICGEYLTKGKQVYIEGSIRSRQWEDQSGNKRTAYEIVARQMTMLGSRAESDAPRATGLPPRRLKLRPNPKSRTKISPSDHPQGPATGTRRLRGVSPTRGQDPASRPRSPGEQGSAPLGARIYWKGTYRRWSSSTVMGALRIRVATREPAAEAT